MNLDNINVSESMVVEETVYTVTASFKFTDKDLEEPDVKRFYDKLVEASAEEEETETNY